MERLVHGLDRVVALDSKEVGESLGAGYKVGWYGWDNLASRKEDCYIEANYVTLLRKNFVNLLKLMPTKITYEEFGSEVNDFHNDGHNVIADNCTTNTSAGVTSGMAFSEVSARDPVFYQWHAHIESIVQQFRDVRFRP